MNIHNHFNGSAHCVECNGSCCLTGMDKHLTQYVRYTMEYLDMQHGGWLPSQIEEAFAGMYGSDWREFRKSAVESARQLKELMNAK